MILMVRETGRKITLNESVFGIEPNDHAIYRMLNSLWLISVRVLISLKKEVKSAVPPVSLAVKKVVVAPVEVTSISGFGWWSTCFWSKATRPWIQIEQEGKGFGS